ncbi:MAG TPA: glycoside hydrolase family 2 TIM barrel-domain containing protein [Capsulimonadaceae bacterium]|jgi:beta-galactosidase
MIAQRIALLLSLAAALCFNGVARAADELVISGTRASMSLNGSWEAVPIPGVALTYPAPATGWVPEVVPSIFPKVLDAGTPYKPSLKQIVTDDWKGFRQKDKLAAWFRRSFSAPQVPAGTRAMLHFDGIAYRSKIVLNGKQIGESVIGQLGQTYDVTGLLKTDAPNLLEVGVAAREAIVDLAAKTYIAPSSGVQTGIYGDISLRLVPALSVDDAFIQTSFRQKQISIAVTVRNDSAAPRTCSVGGQVVDDAGVILTSLPAQSVSVPPGATSVVTLTKPWIAPRLWSPETPQMYVAAVQVRDGDKVVDEVRPRFGFREFWIAGKDFYLNGIRTVLRRNSFLTTVGGASEGAERELRVTAGRPYNSIRLHIGFDNTKVLDACDKFGVMSMPEFAWHNIGADYDLKNTAPWLPNLLDYERRFMKEHRNRPSVVIWNLTNETFWGDTDDARMKVADAVLATAKEMDPTRPQEGDGESNWGGRLPIINIHYPEGTSGALRAIYPNSSMIIPNDLYWLEQSKDSTFHSWRANLAWDRPLVMGEYWDAEGNVDDRSSFMGEEAYDWEKWRLQDFGGRENRKPNSYSDVLAKMTDIYRLQGVAGLNPWAGDRNDSMPPVAVRPLDFHPNFYSGQTAVRKVAIFEDTEQTYASTNLQCRLTIDGVTVWQKIIPVYMQPGKNLQVDVPVECPVVASQTKALLTIRLRCEQGANWVQLSRHEETVYIMPAAQWKGAPPVGIVLLDATGATSAAFAKVGLTVPAKASLAPATLTGARLLIVGQGTDAAPYRDIIEKFVQTGGRVLLLSAANEGALSPELPDTDDKHIASKVWLRSHGNPALGGLEEPQLSYWMPDNIVSTKTANKPAAGKCKILLDAGGLYGIKWTPLIEVSHGAGSYTLSRLNIVDRVGVEPAADTLLVSLVAAGIASPAPKAQPLQLLAGDNAALKQTLAVCSIISRPGLTGTGPVLLDATYTPTPAEIAKLKTLTAAGGNIWLHGFTPTSLPNVAALFPFTPKLAEIDKTVQAGVRRSDDAWMDSISSYDFAWTRIDIGARGDYFGMGQPTASIGKYALVQPTVATATRLIEPGMLWKVPVGKGAILFDTLPWENALGSESDKVVRLVSALTSNLGGDIGVEVKKSYAYFNVDISKQANRAYYDEVAGDGKGGWTDQGVNDMRFFLINHTGKGGGKDTGMEVAVENFPATAQFAGLPFTLVDPKKNDNKAVITLRGKGHDPTSPDAVKGIVVGHKADRLWFLNASCWAVYDSVNKVSGHYIIHYTDGSVVDFPLRDGVELADWWNPKPLTAGKVGWAGKNEMHAPIGIYVTEWVNPHPAKTIATVDLVGDLTEAQIVLLGITGGIEGAAPAPVKVSSGWDFSKAANNAVPNLVAGQPALVPQWNQKSLPPAADGGLRFSHGTTATSDLKGLPGLSQGQPWTLEASFSIDEKPDGYCGGIVQAMAYGKAGMRLTLGQDLRLTAEIWVADGKAANLSSKAPLTLARNYDIRVVFDTTRTFLYINGKLDNAIETPPPAAYAGGVNIGTASGKDYNFNGVIRRVAFLPVEN